MLLQPITVPFSKSTLKPSVYTLNSQQIPSNQYCYNELNNAPCSFMK